MAKEKTGKTKWYIGSGITLAVIFASIVTSYAVQGEKTSANENNMIVHKIDNKEKFAELKKDGCEPGKQASNDMNLVKYRLDSIDTRQEQFSVEQKAIRRDNQTFQKEVLKRLPK